MVRVNPRAVSKPSTRQTPIDNAQADSSMATTLAILLAAVAAAAVPGKPASLARDGGFDRSAAWDLGPATIVAQGNPGPCLRFDRPGAARQEILVARRKLTLTVAVDVKAEGIVAQEGKSGYAFAAIYQTDETGKLIASADFVQLTGTHPWQHHHHTFSVDPRTDFVSLRCGIFQATGVVHFDNWTLVRGEEAKRLEEVEPPATRADRAGDSAAVLCQPGMPVIGAASSPRTIAGILRQAGIEVALLSADQLADPTVFNAARFDLVALPYGQTFPAAARLPLIEFLRGGGDFLSTGGYAFNDPRRLVDGRWVPEAELVRAKLKEATSRQRSLLPDGGFEESKTIAIGTPTPDGRWRRTGPRCTVAADTPHQGARSGRVSIPPAVPNPGAQFQAELPATAGTVYQVSGWMRARDVLGPGMAFMAVYQYDTAGKLVEHRDFAIARGSTEWRRYEYQFSPGPGVTRMHLKLGLYRTRGTAHFDDLRVNDVTGVRFLPINTATGHPGDGLEVSPAQIGVFDPSFPLKRAARMRTSPGQHVVTEPVDLAEPLRGWAASAVIGADNARWVPLLDTRDRYGRPRGAAAALTLNYNGYYAGSCWATFGIENRDLFRDTHGPLARALQQVAQFLLRGVFLHNLATDHRLYREKEPVVASVVVDNRGRCERSGAVRFSLRQAGNAAPLASADQPFQVAPGEKQTIVATFPQRGTAAGLHRLDVSLRVEDRPIDALATGFVVDAPDALEAGPKLRFENNYFSLNGRPTFLFGTDTYARTYQSAAENPLTWFEELRAARDVGMNLYENLQYTTPGHRMADDDWRSFLAMAELTQRVGLVFMPGMLVGHNVAIGHQALDQQSALCREYAAHLGRAAALLYYINGDYQMRLDKNPQDVRRLWNRWLEDRYGTTERLHQAWGDAAGGGELGQIDFPPPNSGRWDDVAAVDRLRFLAWLTRRWNQAHVAAVRQVDADHPITSEYYSAPFAGLDLPLTIDGQDVANIGYFDRPRADIDNLPLRIRFNDLRARGKGVSLGEYGVKTHPAWTEENGAGGYHLVRTEEEQNQLFLAVAHYGLGLGASKVQNWCLRDAQTRIFPWGLFYPNQLVAKDVAYVHRNLSIVWRHFRPRYVPARVAVCLANRLRQGNDDPLGAAVAYRTFSDLLALHHAFNVIDDDHLDQLTPATKVLVYPSPFAVADEAHARLLAWVEGGGTLLVTGDFSYDADRQRTRTRRLEELAGVRFLGENYPNVARAAGSDLPLESTFGELDGRLVRPSIRLEPLAADVLAATAEAAPVLVRHRPGRGAVYYFTDPIELAHDDDAAALRRALYAAVLKAAGQAPLPVEPNEPWLHVLAQPTLHGTVHVVYNTKLDPGTERVRLPTAAGTVELATRNRWPALAAASEDGKLVALSAYGEAAAGGDSVLGGTGLKAVLSLDGEDLRRSEAILVAPFEPGRIALPGRSEALLAIVGEFQYGRWTELERVALQPGRAALDLDADRATCLILLCRPGREQHWAAYLTQAICRPDQIPGD